MNNLLLERLTWDQANMIVEGGGSDEQGRPRKLFMKGIFIQGGVRNHNGRIYPVSEIRKAVEHINDCIRRGESVIGEADHPSGLNINLDRVSHKIVEMWMDGPNGLGKLEILPTPMGNIVRTLIECGVKLGVSSRGTGDVNEYTGEVSNFEIITIDIVARPSAPDAYPHPIFEKRFYSMLYGTRRGDEILAIARHNDPKAMKELKEGIKSWLKELGRKRF